MLELLELKAVGIWVELKAWGSGFRIKDCACNPGTPLQIHHQPDHAVPTSKSPCAVHVALKLPLRNPLELN